MQRILISKIFLLTQSRPLFHFFVVYNYFTEETVAGCKLRSTEYKASMLTQEPPLPQQPFNLLHLTYFNSFPGAGFNSNCQQCLAERAAAAGGSSVVQQNQSCRFEALNIRLAYVGTISYVIPAKSNGLFRLSASKMACSYRQTTACSSLECAVKLLKLHLDTKQVDTIKFVVH